jgi:hypothetical protein
MNGLPVVSLAGQVDEVDHVPAKNPNLEGRIVLEMTMTIKIAFQESSVQV